MQGFARDYASSSPEIPCYGANQQRNYGSGRRKHITLASTGLPTLAQDVVLGHPGSEARGPHDELLFVPGTVADSLDCGDTTPTLPGLLHGPIESNPVEMAVLGAEKYVNRIRPDAMMTTPLYPRLQHPRRYSVSTYS
ncbi:hypothetical protein HPB51_016018 [Rhipicephalus microplus]|uniref:Uncharacterized protein n=1 Tax=Rhipicephalus microplus TaxID=6941 RepID=A0A9J6DI77_RHIMP|nr:hypothetical protein HPB51_016018 [Rhipicephalus microplus]